MTGNTAELVVPAQADYLELIGQFVSFAAHRTGFSDQEVARIRLAVDEACANVVLHGTEAGGGPGFVVVCEEHESDLTIRVRDSGPMFDLEAVPVPDLNAPVERRQVGGLGIFIMREVMDQVEVQPREGGKEVVLVKYIAPRETSDDGR